MKNATKKITNAPKAAKKKVVEMPAAEPVQSTAVPANEAALLAALGPNAKYPFGVRVLKMGVLSYERFKTADTRNLRLEVLKGTAGMTSEAVDYERPLGEPTGITVNGATVEAVPPTKKKAAAPAAKPAPAAKKKAPKADDGKVLVRLYGQGEFYFRRAAAERLGDFPNVAVTVVGKKVTLTPTKSEKDSTPVKRCHTAPVLRVSKLLADTGWSKKTQDLECKLVGERSLEVTIS
jgi:hypothetical protein